MTTALCNRCQQSFDAEINTHLRKPAPFKTCPKCRTRRLKNLHRFYEAHPEIKKQYHNKRMSRARKETWAHYFNGENKCGACGNFYDIRILQMHHVDGDGDDHRREMLGDSRSGGVWYYEKLFLSNFPPLNVQSLCPTCHALIHLDEA